MLCMKNKKEGSMAAKYQVEDFHIVDVTSGSPKKWYIREIMDVTSCEFERSALTHEMRIDMVNELGMSCLERVLAKCFKAFHPNYSAADEAKLFAQVVGLHTQGKSTLSDEDKFRLTMEARLRKAMSGSKP